MLKPKGLGQDTLIRLSCGGVRASPVTPRRSHFHFHFHSSTVCDIAYSGKYIDVGILPLTHCHKRGPYISCSYLADKFIQNHR